MTDPGKIPNQNTHPNLRRGGGRPKGSINKTSRAAKDMIQDVADGMGGAPRMLAWVKESPDNERVFWSQIYPKLIPVQVHGDSEHPLVLSFTIGADVPAKD